MDDKRRRRNQHRRVRRAAEPSAEMKIALAARAERKAAERDAAAEEAKRISDTNTKNWIDAEFARVKAVYEARQAAERQARVLRLQARQAEDKKKIEEFKRLHEEKINAILSDLEAQRALFAEQKEKLEAFLSSYKTHPNWRLFSAPARKYIETVIAPEVFQRGINSHAWRLQMEREARLKN